MCLLIWLRWFVAICCLLGDDLCYWLLLADLLVCLTSFCWVGCLRPGRFVWWLSGLRVWVGWVRIWFGGCGVVLSG